MRSFISSEIAGRPIALPDLVPLALARAIPARTRSRIIARSNSANLKHRPPRRRGGIDALLMKIEMIPLARSSSRKPSRSIRLRPSRSTAHAATMSISRRATARSNARMAGRASRSAPPLTPRSSKTAVPAAVIAACRLMVLEVRRVASWNTRPHDGHLVSQTRSTSGWPRSRS